MTYKTKILLLFISISILPLLLLMLYFLGPYTTEQEQRLTHLMESIIWQKKNNLITELNDYQRILSSMMTNPEITSSLKNLENKGRQEAADSVNTIRTFFTDSMYLKGEIEGFLYYNPDTGLYLSNNRLNVQDAELVTHLLDHAPEFAQDIELMRESLTHIATFEIEDINGNHIPIFLLGEKFLDANRLEFNGYIFVLINEERLNKLLNSPMLDRSIFTQTFLVDESDMITASHSPSVTNTPYSIDMYGSDGQYLDTSLPVGKAGLSLVTVSRREDVYGNRFMFLLIPMIIVSITSVIAIIAIKNYLTKVVQYISEIHDSMTLSDNQVHFTLKSNKDLALIAQTFDQMKHQINSLLIDQQEKNLILLRNEEERRIAEIKAMEAQVNPHFLYNILNTLNWVAIDQKAFAISSGITSLANLLRYTLSHIDTMATVAEEVLWLENYLALQKLRYDDLFAYTISWDQTLAEERIYKLLLQPFIENSIVHGFHGVSYQGVLEVTLHDAGDHIDILIRDNGKGFDPVSRNLSTGIETATSRIRLYYGERASWSIDSGPYGVTVVQLAIPKWEDRKNT